MSTYPTYPDTQINKMLQKARSIRTTLEGSDVLSDIFPAKPKSMRWKKYWELFMEAREIERPLAGLIEKPKLQQFGNGKWAMTNIPQNCSEMDEFPEEFYVPASVSDLLASLDTIEKSNGILILRQDADLASMFMILSHPKSNKIKEIRHKNWAIVDIEEIKKKHSTGIRQFKDLFQTNVPDFIFELHH